MIVLDIAHRNQRWLSSFTRTLLIHLSHWVFLFIFLFFLLSLIFFIESHFFYWVSLSLCLIESFYSSVQTFDKTEPDQIPALLKLLASKQSTSLRPDYCIEMLTSFLRLPTIIMLLAQLFILWVSSILELEKLLLFLVNIKRVTDSI